jgi:hypothetical protein
MKKWMYISSVPFFISGYVDLFSGIYDSILYPVYIVYFFIWVVFWWIRVKNKQITKKAFWLCLLTIIISLPVQAMLLYLYLVGLIQA